MIAGLELAGWLYAVPYDIQLLMVLKVQSYQPNEAHLQRWQSPLLPSRLRQIGTIAALKAYFLTALAIGLQEGEKHPIGIC